MQDKRRNLSMNQADHIAMEPPSPMCDLCREFITDVLAWKLAGLPDYPPEKKRWTKQPGDISDTYQHLDTLEDLRTSAERCEMCAIIASTFTEKGADGTSSLDLCPFWEPKSYKSGTYFTATFNGAESGKWRNEGRDSRNFRPSNKLQIVRRRPYVAPTENQPAPNNTRRESDFERALSRTFAEEDALATARALLKACADTHTACARKPLALPTRVIDVGASPDDPPRLYVTHGEEEPYIALSHCWGGNIPCKMVSSNLASYQAGLPMTAATSASGEVLPQNFLDAIFITRALGLRYVWIDALCIIQDSQDDWNAEAARMADVYAGSVLTVVAMDASKSTEGFLHNPRGIRQVIINEDWAVREELPSMIEMLARCPLGGRGWCAQERMLPRALLHYGRQEMLWECATQIAEEKDGAGRQANFSDLYIGDPSSGLSSVAVSWFLPVRKRFAQRGARPESLAEWQAMVQEYSRRSLTFGTDKLPAVAGIAQLFRAEHLKAGQYVAGLWTGDLIRGLTWSASTTRMPGAKAAGFHGRVPLARPMDRRMPSWSWASVDGAVEFHARDKDPEKLAESGGFQVLDIICNLGSGLDDLMAQKVDCSLRIRAPMLKATYSKGTWDGVGMLRAGNPTRAIYYCVMDIDPDLERECWIAKMPTGMLLVLEEVGEAQFVRRGLCMYYNIHEGPVPLEFVSKEFVLE